MVEALFPIPRAEEVVLAMDGNTAFHTLPRAKKSPVNESCSIYSYKDERVWRLIWALKYKKSVTAARIAAFAIFQTLSIYSRVAFPIIIIPMPISRRRRRERGYNQCELIADELERLIANTLNMSRDNSIPIDQNINCMKSTILIVRDLLLRTHHKSRQTLKDREERLDSAHDIFEVNDDVAGRVALLLKIRPRNNTDTFAIHDGLNRHSERIPNSNPDADLSVTHIIPSHSRSNFTNDRIVETNRSQYLLIVIDDVVTTGSTIRDAVLRLRDAGFTQAFGLSVAH